jgi:hypothetical protein
MPLPVVGNFHSLIKNGVVKFDVDVFKQYGKTLGYFEGSSPSLMTIDVDLIKAITIKDFHNFTNRRVGKKYNIDV